MIRPLRRGRATSPKIWGTRALSCGDTIGSLTLVFRAIVERSLHPISSPTRFLSNMDPASVNGNGARPYASPDSHAKLSQHSPTDEQDAWSGEGSSGDEAVQASGATKRKRPLSVSCEICKQRKVSVTQLTVSGSFVRAIASGPCHYWASL